MAVLQRFLTILAVCSLFFSRITLLLALPDYLVEENNRLVQLFGESDSIQLDTYFVYPEELKSVARVQVFRDFVVSKAQRWPS